ncbi:MAG: LysE family transporter, partial [Desulfobacterales bacterium]
RHGIGAGLKVSIAPLITDVPIILVSLFLLNRLAQYKSILGCISIFGALFILYLAFESLRTRGVELNLSAVKTGSFKKGVITNALNPHPYIFYMTVGTPIIYRSLQQNILATLSFVGSFLLLLVGSKVVLALVVGRSRTFLKERLYIWVMRILGVLLIIFSIVLLRDGFELLGWL